MMTPSVDDWFRHGRTVGDLLATRAAQEPERPFIILLSDTRQEEILTYGRLYEGARRTAAGLQAQGVKPGDRVMLSLPTSREFLEVFFGILLVGAAAVPCYPPARTKGLDLYQAALGKLMTTAGARAIVTFGRARLVVEAAAFQAGVDTRVLLAGSLASDAAAFQAPTLDAEDLALVQFSSGSTGNPKGVMLTHRALLANITASLAVIRPQEGERLCSWLPLYHDMGLIAGILMPLYRNMELVLLSPQAFLLDPKRWLWTIHRYRCAITVAPNFAYQLVATRLQDAELEGLDLSCLRLAYNGAEPVLPSTRRLFTERFAAYGFNARTYIPIYGMAEVAVGAVFPRHPEGARLDRIDPLRLVTEGLAVPSSEPSLLDNSGAYLGVGAPLPGYRLRIAGPDGQELPERTVGEVQLQGPSVMAGYLNDPAATEAAFQDGWLRTGDLGYVADGELFLVGRLKDMILKGGRNYAPQDLESAASAVPGIRKGCVAAFGVPNQAAGTEAVVVVAETREPSDRHGDMVRQVAQAVGDAVGLKPDTVVLVPPGTVPKTSSGKLQRRRCRDMYLAGELTPMAEPNLIDHARLFGRAIAHRFGANSPLAKETKRHD